MGLPVSGGGGGTVAEEWHLVKIVVLWWVGSIWWRWWYCSEIGSIWWAGKLAISYIFSRLTLALQLAQMIDFGEKILNFTTCSGW